MTPTWSSRVSGNTPGAKYTFVSVGVNGSSQGFALGLGRVTNPAPSEEYKVDLEILGRITSELNELDPERRRRPVSLAIDGAPTGSQIGRTVKDYGLLLTTPPKRSQAPKKGKPEIMKTHSLPELACKACGSINQFSLNGSQWLRWQIVNDGLKSKKVTAGLQIRNTAHRTYFYATLPCSCGGRHLIPFTPMEGETTANYNRRMELMRPWERSSSQYRAIYRSLRAKAENDNTRRDRSFPFKRIPAYGEAAQTSLVVALEFGRAVVALATHRAARAPANAA